MRPVASISSIAEAIDIADVSGRVRIGECTVIEQRQITQEGAGHRILVDANRSPSASLSLRSKPLEGFRICNVAPTGTE